MTRPFFSKRERAAVVRALRLLSALTLLAAAALLALALISYSPEDDGFYVSTAASPSNWLGDPGALVADVLRMTFGLAAFYLPAFLAFWGARFWLGKGPRAMLRRLIAAPFALLALSAFASSHAVEAASGGGLGGIVGDYLFSVLAKSAPIDSDRARLIAGAVLSLLLSSALTLWSLGAGTRLAGKALRRGQDHVAAFWALLSPTVGGAAASLAARHAERRAARRATRADASSDDSLGDRLDGALRRAGRALGLGAGAGFGAEPAFAGMDPGDRTPPEETSGRWVDRLAQRVRPEADAERALNVPRAPRDLPGALSGAPSGDLPPEPPMRAADAASDAPAPTARPGSFSALDDDPIDPAAHRDDDMSAPADALASDWDRDWDAYLDAAAESDTPETLELTDLAPTPAMIEETATASAADADADADELLDIQTDTIDSTPPSRPTLEARPEPTPTLPALSLLSDPPADAPLQSEKALADQADRLQEVLNDYGVRGEIIDVHPGPVVSQFELEPAPGLKASRVVGLADDIARSMSASAARVARIPGRNTIGIELPNARREIVSLKALLADQSYGDGDNALPLALGRDIAGAPVVADLARMPHLLIAGTTGSGKSVAINTMLLSLLYSRSPAETRLLLIDPKMLELSVYNGVPHLLAPVVTDPKKAIAALQWVVREMESRYQRMARLNVRSLQSYNQKIAEATARGESLERVVRTGFDDATGELITEVQAEAEAPMPYIVVVIDEMADLMMVAGKEIEHCVQRLAQMARASGIHLIMATQRPSVDVITGVIKANFPIRISFQVTSKFDSRTILGEAGAEQLLGKGDMLFTAGGGRLQRLHGPFVADDEVAAVAEALRAQGGGDDPVDFEAPEPPLGGGGGEGTQASLFDVTDVASGGETGDEALYAKAVAIVTRERRASTSFVQRRLQIGYNRAARLIEMMEDAGVVSPANRVGKREVLAEPPAGDDS